MKIFAGPCAMLRDHGKMVQLAYDLKEAGADVFRAATHKGGTFPPAQPEVWGACDPMALARIKDTVGIAVCNEVGSMPQFWAQMWADYIWLPARKFQAYDFVREVAASISQGVSPETAGPLELAHPPTGQGLMLKRSMGATVREICGMIEHVKSVGYPTNLLWIIERGIGALGTDDVSRWRLDLMIVPQIKEKYPDVKVCVDVTHGVGRREYAYSMAKASVGAGADGLMLEVLDKPEESPSDARETIDLETFKQIMGAIK